MPVCQEAMEVAETVFQLTRDLPKSEDYGLTSQIRRAAVSISANIAEGFGRRSSADKRKFYDYARGSAFETQSLLMYGTRVNYFKESTTDDLHEKLQSIIYDINKINKSFSQP